MGGIGEKCPTPNLQRKPKSEGSAGARFSLRTRACAKYSQLKFRLERDGENGLTLKEGEEEEDI